MIDLQNHSGFRLITQYNHSLISGQLASALQEQYLDNRRDDVILAIREHDRAWIPLDEQPLWNFEAKQPFSFQDYPLAQKVEAYKRGIDELEASSVYAAFLCSLHYASFFNGMEEDLRIRPFLLHEQERRKKMMEVEKVAEQDEEVRYHFNLLQFFDNLSLYICLNWPNCSKNEEISWYREGFGQTFAWNEYQKIIPVWLDEHTVGLSFFPFIEAEPVQLPYQFIEQEVIDVKGFQQAYNEAKEETLTVEFRKNG